MVSGVKEVPAGSHHLGKGNMLHLPPAGTSADEHTAMVLMGAVTLSLS